MSLHGESLPTPSAPSAVEQRIRLNVLFGVPDDGRGVVRVAPDGKTLLPYVAGSGRGSFTLRGSANIAPYLSPERFALNRFYLQDDARARISLGPGAILNHIADPDICSGALARLERITSQVRRPCFNHPSAVARTTRDGVARLLYGIDHLIVPKTIRVEQTSPALVREAARDAGLRYPILVRVVGSHGGEDRVQIERPDAMHEIRQLKRDGRSLFLTEFCDFVSRDGLYRKFRIVLVGDDIFLRHCVVASHWSVHGRHRVEGADKEEAALFESFDAEWAPSLKPVFREITRRLGLDYFGVDCHIDGDRNVLLFEANACMKILKNYKVSPNRFDAPIAKIKTALEDRLASPETWRHDARGG
jgi:glutathione synthase/RimK-type ligase-like ATP-grasp enzyme